MLSGTFLERLIVGVAWLMTVGDYWLLKRVSVRVISDVLLRHHQSLIRVLGRVSLAVLYTERIRYVHSVVSFTREVT